MDTITEPSRKVQVTADCDLCVVGGSCTGVFAAVRAARLGLDVCLVEANGFFGGMATAARVSIWHSFCNTTGDTQIIGGLTTEIVERMKHQKAVHIDDPTNPSRYCVLNTDELMIELDRLIAESKVRPFLHARFVSAIGEDGACEAIIIEDKSGRRAIRAHQFIDATGDGDLIDRLGFPTRKSTHLQPPTMCASITGLDKLKHTDPSFSLGKALYDPAHPDHLPDGFVWTAKIVGVPDVTLVAGTRVNNADCSDADQLTQAEIEGRRQVGSILRILRDQPGGDHIALAALPAMIGIRETRHAECLYTVTEQDLLHGVAFDDAIGYGCYRVDIHHSDREGITFRYLDGREVDVFAGKPNQQRRWRPDGEDCATYYQIPYRALVPTGARNVLATGRLIGSDQAAYGALRVMVNCNQTGEAAGVASALALQANCDVAQVQPQPLRARLADGGSIMLPS